MSLSKYVNKMNQEMLVPDSPKCNCEDEVVLDPETVVIDDSIEDIDDAQEEITEFLEESGEPIDAVFSNLSISARIVNSPNLIGTTTTLLKKVEDDVIKMYFG